MSNLLNNAQSVIHGIGGILSLWYLFVPLGFTTYKIFKKRDEIELFLIQKQINSSALIWHVAFWTSLTLTLYVIGYGYYDGTQPAPSGWQQIQRPL